MQALPRRLQFKTVGFPHSDISGSKATNRLPEAFRRLVASFIAVLGQGIHRVLLCLPYGDLHSTLTTRTLFHHDGEVVVVQLPMHIRMSKIGVPIRNENRPKGRFSCALCTRGLTAFPLLRVRLFGT